MKPVIRIGLVFSHSLAYCRGVLHGVKQFAERFPQWSFLSVAPDVAGVRTLAPLRPAGIIAHVISPELARALARLRVPIVNVSGVLPELKFPRVGVDDVACGRLAAEHLLSRGLRHLAFVGHRDHAYSVRREEGFRQCLHESGFDPSCYYERRRRPFDPMGRLWAQDAAIQQWIGRLPRPIGIFAPNDLWGVQLTEVCLETGLSVPEEVCIIGVDNDDLLCGLARPALTSIALPMERIGFEAAALLRRLLRRPGQRPRPMFFPPVGVVARRSTDILALDDPDLAAALRFIHDQSHRPIRVWDILQAVPVSRRSLERRMRRCLGRSLLEEIRRVHVEQARRLLAETDLPMHVVAEQSGFTNGRQFSTVIRQMTGVTPSEYRRQFRSRRAEGL